MKLTWNIHEHLSMTRLDFGKSLVKVTASRQGTKSIHVDVADEILFLVLNIIHSRI